jgi:hypothetical protein
MARVDVSTAVSEITTREITCMTDCLVDGGAGAPGTSIVAPRPLRVTVALIAVLLLALACCAASAHAAATHVFSSSFGTAGSGDGQFALADASHGGGASGVAVDAVGGAVFAVDTGNNRVEKFDASGVYVSQFGTVGAGNGQLTDPTGIAVDNSGVLPGAVYVLDHGNNRIEKFTAAGAYSAQITGTPGGPFGELYGAATDAAGHLWVYQSSAEVDEFAADGTFLQTFNCPCGTSPGLAVNVNGLVFSDRGARVPAILDGNAAGNYLGDVAMLPGAATTGLATDPASGDLYVDEGTGIEQFAAANILSGSIDTFGGGHLTAGGGLAVSATDTIYVADAATNTINIFNAAVLADATTTPATAVTSSAARLNATVNPNSPPASAVSDCHFDYVTDAAFQADVTAGHDGYTDLSSGGSAPCTAIPAGNSPTAVHADVTGLSSGTIYHFRISVTDAGGTALGHDVSFGVPGAPGIGAESVGALTTTMAQIRVGINPTFSSTTYHVEYGTDTTYDHQTAESATIGADHSEHPIHRTVSGLTAGTTYHWRVVATNAFGSSNGPDQTFTTLREYSPPQAVDPCPNDQLRAGAGSRLPDCRAYEQASPVDKHGAGIQTASSGITQAASTGAHVTFSDSAGLPTTGGSSQLSVFAASRGASGWSTNGLLPPTEPGREAHVLGWNDDLSVSLSGVASNAGGGIYLGDTASQAWSKLADAPNAIADARLAGFAADGAHAIFESPLDLAPGAVIDLPNLYDFDHGAITLVGRVPSGSATACDDSSHSPDCVPAVDGAFAGPYDWNRSDLSTGGASADLSFGGYYTDNTISADGSKVTFTEGGTGRLFLRVNGSRTVEVNASQASSPDPNGAKPAAWMAGTPSGTKIFFTSCEKLTDDSTAVSTSDDSCTTPSQGQDLYVYDTSSGQLTDLTVDAGSDPLGAAVQGVLGASDDGSSVYFVANGVLASGAAPGDCVGAQNLGACSLYVSHNGAAPVFVARLDPGLAHPSDFANWRPGPGPAGVNDDGPRSSRVAADGTLVFRSLNRLTAYDNTPADGACGTDFLSHAPVPCSEFYRYQPGDSRPACISCNPTGNPPVGTASLNPERVNSLTSPSQLLFRTRNLSADGDRVFFQSADQLVSGDTNSAGGCAKDPDDRPLCSDVYEWEADGSGSCHSGAQNGGCLSLLTTGTGGTPQYFGDASASGDDVFILTDQALVPQDIDTTTDVYDVRVDGGLASQHPEASAPCSGDACQGPPTAPPVEVASGSSVFLGAGNAVPARPGRLSPVRVTRKSVRGSSLSLTVSIPAKGRLTITGTGLSRFSKSLSKAGSYRVTVKLTASARKTLKRKHKLTLKPRLAFSPASGASSTVKVTVTSTSARRADANLGGSR